MHKAAKKYVEQGWSVFPLHSIDEKGECTCGEPSCSDAGKHPRVQRGLKEASRDLNKIDEWFGPDAPLSNIAIATGKVSGITVIDIDIGDGKFGADNWVKINKEHGEPKTLMSQTGSGGMHALFKYNSALKTASNILGKGIDCRNDNGYIVAPPSMHRSGNKYEWVDQNQELTDLPAHLSQRKEARGRPKKDDPYRKKYAIEEIENMLQHIPAEDYDLWRAVGIILGREFDRSDEAWKIYNDWADKAGGKDGRNRNEKMSESFYKLSQQKDGNQLTVGTIVQAAIQNGWAPKRGEVPIENFIYYGPGNNYVYRITTSYWTGAAVDAAVSPINKDKVITKPSIWLKENLLVTSMTCDPIINGDLLKGHDCRNGEIIESVGASIFNSYRKPTIELGDAKLAKQFLKHVNKLFDKPGDAEQFLNYMAHRVQKPWEKPRFALLIAGGQGVGKDMLIDFCAPAIGSWNLANIDPAAFESGFNEYQQATLVRISEAANLQEMNKWAFNERTKVLIAGSPDICQINPKYGQKYSVRMHCGVILTTNHLAEGIFIPQDDRRYDVISCATFAEMGLSNEEKRKQYFTDLWGWWLNEGGKSHVAAYLNEKDISLFSPNNGQRKTEAHATIVAGGMGGDEWLDDILNELDYPIAVRSDKLIKMSTKSGENPKNTCRRLSASMGRLDYVMFKNENNRDGRWSIGGKKVTVYVKVGEVKKDFNPLIELKPEKEEV